MNHRLDKAPGKDSFSKPFGSKPSNSLSRGSSRDSSKEGQPRKLGQRPRPGKESDERSSFGQKSRFDKSSPNKNKTIRPPASRSDSEHSTFAPRSRSASGKPGFAKPFAKPFAKSSINKSHSSRSSAGFASERVKLSPSKAGLSKPGFPKASPPKIGYGRTPQETPIAAGFASKRTTYTPNKRSKNAPEKLQKKLAAAATTDDKTQRLSKVMAAGGVASRRTCEEIIFAGRVKVNSKIVLIPQTPVSNSDTIYVDDHPLKGQQEKVYYILNKPDGFICSAAGKRTSKLVLNIFAEVGKRLFTVGRLDRDTTGLLIVTNDGHFANRVIHPSSNIAKEYLVKTSQEISPEHLAILSNGTWVEDSFVKPQRVTKVRRGTFKIIIMEGKKREIRKLADAADLTVESLSRIRIGALQLGTLPLGAFRPLTEREKELIFE